MERGNVYRNNRSNVVDEQSKKLLEENTMYIMRDKYTKMPLGISFTEEGLRFSGNKNGIYHYCAGRVNNYLKAKEAPKNPNIIVERFIPKDYPNNPKLASAEIHWVNQAKRYLTANSNANYNH